MLACLCAVAFTLAAGSPGGAAGSPPFQIVASVHYGQQQNASGYSAVVALAPGDAWVFGGTNPGGSSSPVAEHWDGRHWRASPLPAGLSGFIVAAYASSPRNVWAVGDGYALRWNGTRWTEAKTWSTGQATSVVALGHRDDWLFGSSGFSGEPGIGAWHYAGHSWTRVTGIAAAIYRASAVSASDIWAITFSAGGGSVLRYDGSDWDLVPAGAALANTQLGDILAESASSVWVSGLSPASGTDESVVLAHWDGQGWTRFTAPWPAQQAERIAPDGAGGIWIPVVAGGTSPQTWLLHLSRSGHWTRVAITARPTAGLGIGDLALIPGTKLLWGAGGLLTATGGNAVILGGGTDDWLAALRSDIIRADHAGSARIEHSGSRPSRSARAGPPESAQTGQSGSAGTGPPESAGTGQSGSAGTGQSGSARAGPSGSPQTRPPGSVSPWQAYVPARRRPVPRPGRPRQAGPLSGAGPRSGPGSRPGAA